jgi:hypothetical protein
MRDVSRLPKRFPVGTKYVLEGRGRFVRRYVEFPDGRRLPLELRKAQTCHCTAWQKIGLVPAMGAAETERSAHPKAASAIATA